MPDRITPWPMRMSWVSLNLRVRNPFRARPAVMPMKKHACKKSGSICRNSLIQGKIRAGPQGGALLQCAVAEEGDHDLLCAGDGDDLLQGQRPGRTPFLGLGASLPQGQTQQQHCGQRQLDEAHRAVAAAPVAAAREDGTHDVGSHGGSDAPHTVQPAHVTAGVVQCHIVIQAGIDAASSQTVGDRPQAEHRVRMAGGKAKQGRRRYAHADGRDPAGPQPEGQPVAEQAGNHGAAGDDGEQNARMGYRHGQLRVNGGPCSTQQSVGKAEADEGKIDDGQ